MNIRKQTCLIIWRGPEYLVGTILYSTDLRWSRNRYDAWRTRDRKQAEKVARATGGDLWLFNPVTGEAREARYGKDEGGGVPDA